MEPFQTRGLKTSLLSKLSVKSHVTDPLQLVEIVVGFFLCTFGTFPVEYDTNVLVKVIAET